MLGVSMRQKIKDYTLYLLFALALLCSAYLFYKYVLNIIAPFLIAYLLAFVIRAASDKFIGKTKIPKGAVRVLIAILFFALLLFALISKNATTPTTTATTPQPTHIIHGLE
jgi:predicted PurR-regulated permease PerM